MFDLRKWLTLLTALLLILFVMHQLWQIYRCNRRGAGNWYLFTALTTAAALTLLVDNLSLWFDTFTGLNNFSWYVGYSLGVISPASAGLVDCQMGNEGRYAKRAQMLAFLTICVLLLMAFLYRFHMRNTSEWVARDPRSWYEVIFALSFFLYDTVVTVTTLQIARQAMQLEHNPLVRMRLQIGNICRYSAIVFFVSKLSYIVLTFARGGFLWLNQRHNPWTHYQRMRLLRELEALQEQLEEIIPLAERYRYAQASLFSADLQMVLYRVVIQILDCKKILDGYLSATPEERRQYPEISWNQEQWCAATRIHRALLPLNQLTGDSLQEMVKALQLAARGLQSR